MYDLLRAQHDRRGFQISPADPPGRSRCCRCESNILCTCSSGTAYTPPTGPAWFRCTLTPPRSASPPSPVRPSERSNTHRKSGSLAHFLTPTILTWGKSYISISQKKGSLTSFLFLVSSSDDRNFLWSSSDLSITVFISFTPLMAFSISSSTYFSPSWEISVDAQLPSGTGWHIAIWTALRGLCYTHVSGRH